MYSLIHSNYVSARDFYCIDNNNYKTGAVKACIQILKGEQLYERISTDVEYEQLMTKIVHKMNDFINFMVSEGANNNGNLDDCVFSNEVYSYQYRHWLKVRREVTKRIDMFFSEMDPRMIMDIPFVGEKTAGWLYSFLYGEYHSPLEFYFGSTYAKVTQRYVNVCKAFDLRAGNTWRIRF